MSVEWPSVLGLDQPGDRSPLESWQGQSCSPSVYAAAPPGRGQVTVVSAEKQGTREAVGGSG